MYSVKIGEIHLRSDEPITMEQRAEILKQFKNEGYDVIIELLRDDAARFVPDKF